MNAFFLGNTYKKYFFVEYSKQHFICYLSTNKANKFIIDTYDNNYEQLYIDNQSFYKYQRNTETLNNKFAFRYDNYNIIGLNVQNNNIEKLIIEQLKHLQLLDFSYNNLKLIAFDKNPNLYSIVGFCNKLTTIDLSKNKKLKYIDLSHNNLTEIDFRYNTNLLQAELADNQINHLEFSNSIKRLNLAGNSFTQLIIPKDSQLEFLNISNNTSLTRIDVYGRKLKTVIYENTPNLQRINYFNKN